MLTALTTIFGAITSAVPAIVKMFERKQELAHERELIKLKIEAAEKNADIELRISATKGAINERKALLEHDSSLSGNQFIETLRASVRPVITYVFFLMFIVIKCSAAYVMLNNGSSVPDMLKSVWDLETTAIFGSIIGFWFGTRTFEKFIR